MVTRAELIVGKGDYMMSLSKLTGKQVSDVTFYVSTETGEPVMKVCEVWFSDGSRMGVEGEHDFPYLTDYASYPMPNTDEETLLSLMEQEE